MAHSFVDSAPLDVVNHARWRVACSPAPGQMAPTAFGEWATINCRTSDATDFVEESPFNLQGTSQLNSPAPSWALEEKVAPLANAAERQLHIFRLDREGRPRMTYRKAGGNGGLLSTSRRSGKPPHVPSPSKFELAAVAAICNPAPASRAPRIRAKAPKPFRYPSPHSFVPGRQVPRGTSSREGEREPASSCIVPLATTRRPDRWAKKEPPEAVVSSFLGLSCRAQAGPSEAHWERGMGRREGGRLGMGPVHQSPEGSGGSLLLGSSSNTSLPPALRWTEQKPDGIASAESIRSPDGSVSHHLVAAPAHTAGPAACSFGQALPEVSLVTENAIRSPFGWKEPTSIVRQAAFAEGPNFRSFLPPMQPWQTVLQRNTEESEELCDDQRAEVVTVYGTDRFWDLMRNVAELQRGPTCLMSSSVTFDSVLLPGGELQYSMIEQGSFGKVFVGSHMGIKVAIKVPVECMLSTDPAGVMERTLNEWKILSMCQHPNVVRLVGGIVHGPFDVWLVTQLVNGSDLHSRKYSRDPRVRRFISPENGLYMCRQLAAVVAYLHTPVPGRKPVVVHRDIKPENVLIADDWTIQLCDFGDAEASADGRVSRISGATWFYAPAELLRCSPVECMASNSGVQLPPFNEKWDIWSMGCVFQEMFGFFNPMHVHISSRDSPSVIYEKLKSKAIAGALVPDIAEEIQGIARNIISRCLHPDPSARPSAVEVLNMWTARDEDILKDIHTQPDLLQAKVVGSSSLNSSNRQHFPGIVSEPQQLLSKAGLLPTVPNLHFTSGGTSSGLCGQLSSPVNPYALAGSSGTFLLGNRERDNWVTENASSSTQFPVICGRPFVAKEGTRCVQSQKLPVAVGWQ